LILVRAAQVMPLCRKPQKAGRKTGLRASGGGMRVDRRFVIAVANPIHPARERRILSR
jgi:hypothetical protein